MKTEMGQAAFNARSELFSSRQRRAFIVVDGNRTVAEILAMMAPMGLQPVDLDTMVGHGFLEAVSANPDLESPSVKTKAPPKMTEKERYLMAKPIATQLTASLGIMGFRLNLAVEAASGTEDLLALLPKIQAAAGMQKSEELERLLKG